MKDVRKMMDEGTRRYVVKLEDENVRLRAALWAFVDDEPCRLDHEGYCQTHGVSRPCRVVTARTLLAGDDAK